MDRLIHVQMRIKKRGHPPSTPRSAPGETLARRSGAMAQREEQKAELRSSEATTAAAGLCANDCGFHGSPATENLCQSCFVAAAGLEGRSSPPPPSPPSPSCSRREKVPRSVRIRRMPERAERREEERAVNRCFGCRRRVGLTAFRCRCGEMFCPEHRYTDRHVCSYDYKAAGREAIARENPVIRAAKIVRV